MSNDLTKLTNLVRDHASQPYKTFAETGEMHPAVLEVLQYMTWAHLPEHLQPISRTLGLTAFRMAAVVPQCPELTRGLHALLVAKDSLVRAALNLDDVGRRTVAEVMDELTVALERMDRPATSNPA